MFPVSRRQILAFRWAGMAGCEGCYAEMMTPDPLLTAQHGQGGGCGKAQLLSRRSGHWPCSWAMKNGQCTPATTSLAGFILGGFYVNGDETETEAGVFLIRRYKGQRTLPGATSDPASYSDAFRSRRILNRCTKLVCPAHSEFIFHQIPAAYSPHPLSHRLNSAVIHCKADLI